MTRGDLVQYLFVKGDRSEHHYGIVEKCGHKTMTIRWEGGSVGRVKRGMFDIRPIADPEIRKRVRANLSRIATARSMGPMTGDQKAIAANAGNAQDAAGEETT
jgi:hypothetical protein